MGLIENLNSNSLYSNTKILEKIINTGISKEDAIYIVNEYKIIEIDKEKILVGPIISSENKMIKIQCILENLLDVLIFAIKEKIILLSCRDVSEGIDIDLQLLSLEQKLIKIYNIKYRYKKVYCEKFIQNAIIDILYNKLNDEKEIINKFTISIIFKYLKKLNYKININQSDYYTIALEKEEKGHCLIHLKIEKLIQEIQCYILKEKSNMLNNKIDNSQEIDTLFLHMLNDEISILNDCLNKFTLSKCNHSKMCNKNYSKTKQNIEFYFSNRLC